MEFGILTTYIPNSLSCEFEMFTIQIADRSYSRLSYCCVSLCTEYINGCFKVKYCGKPHYQTKRMGKEHPLSKVMVDIFLFRFVVAKKKKLCLPLHYVL